jgi:hypothetical protein
MLAGASEQTFFLECTDSLRADLERHFFAVYNDSLGLEVWFPNFLGVALREADVVAKLLAFAGDFTFLHYFYPITLSNDFKVLL